MSKLMEDIIGVLALRKDLTHMDLYELLEMDLYGYPNLLDAVNGIYPINKERGECAK